MGTGGIKNSGENGDVVYGWPLSCLLVAVASSFGKPTLLVSAALRLLTECKANQCRQRRRRSFTCCFSFAGVAVLFVSDDQPPPPALRRRHRASFVLSGTSWNAAIVVELEVCKDDCQLVVLRKWSKLDMHLLELVCCKKRPKKGPN